MRFAILFMLLPFAVQNSLAQKATVVHQAGVTLKRTPSGERFYFLQDEIQDTAMTYVATIRVQGTIQRNNAGSILKNIRKKAFSLGANSFKLSRLSGPNTMFGELEVAVFYAGPEAIAENAGLKEHNTVYVFNEGQNETRFKRNGQDEYLSGHSYAKYTVLAGESITLSKGGIIGTEVTYTWSELQPPKYVLSRDGSVGPAVGPSVGMQGIGVGVSFKRGKFILLNAEEGELLTYVY